MFSGGVFVVPYTNKSLACLWLIILGLCALTASDVVARPWLPLLLLVALAAPTLILRSNEPVAVIARSRSRPRIGADRAVPSGQVARVDCVRGCSISHMLLPGPSV